MINVMPYMTMMTDMSALDVRKCHWHWQLDWVSEGIDDRMPQDKGNNDEISYYR